MAPAKRGGKRVGYVRISSVGQNAERQLDGVNLDKRFIDKASGKDTKRPQLQAALDYLRDGDVLVVHSMDRLARNLDDLRKIVMDLTGRGVTVEFEKERLTFTGEDNAMSKLLLSMMGAFAEFERSLIRERQREGIALAKKAGVYKGRRPSLTPDRSQELRARVASGEKKAALAREFEISRETLYQYVRVNDDKESCPRSVVGKSTDRVNSPGRMSRKGMLGSGRSHM
ncbi:recombinase family protein [Tunturiibacter lichenicola]|uniref:recombinase family protein n=1 Tax=Tunturiibacter lichenicola TaxID=2051959 RepID=UPI003D9B8253